MTEVNPPAFIDGQCYTFENFRQVFNGVVCVEGVTAAGDLAVTPVGGASVDVNVAAGTAWVEGSLNGAKGMYHIENNASVAVTIAANGAGSIRYDAIIASVYDSQYIGAADNWAIEVVQGVAGAGAPAIPAGTRSGYLLLDYVGVPASGGTPSTVDGLNPLMVTCGKATDTTFPYVTLKANASTSVNHYPGAKQIDLATTEHIDSDYFTVAGSDITIVEDGVYDIGWSLYFVIGSPGSWVGSGPSKNGTSYANLITGFEEGDLAWTYWADTTRSNEPLAAGDVIRLLGWQNSGSAKNATTGRLTIRKVG